MSSGGADDARWDAAAGADAAVAQGREAGGHVRGQVATFPLVPRVVDAVAPLPVLAAGGVADGRGLAAALALGADGAWIGTRFLLSEEAAAHPVYKECERTATEEDTVYSELFDGCWPNAPHRSLRNSTVARRESAGSPPPGRRPGEGEVVATSAGGAPIERYRFTPPARGATGELEQLVLYAGQGVGLADRLQPAADIVRDIAAQAVETLARCAALAQE